MLYIIATKSVEPMLYTMAQKVYNIENDVIHYCHNKCITSKTMLYTIGTNSAEPMLYTMAQKLYNIETMLYTIGTCKVYNIENDVIQNCHTSV